MPAKINMINRVFGRLTVAHEHSKDTYNKIMYMCFCSCGNNVVTLGQSLRNGSTRSCGCLQAEQNKNQMIHLANIRRNLDGKNALRKVYNAYKKGAKQRGYIFELTLFDVESITSNNCYYCNVKPYQISKYKEESYVYNGIDRKDNTKGYTLDNVVTCCGRCNRAKDIMSPSEFDQWIEHLYTTLQQRREL